MHHGTGRLADNVSVRPPQKPQEPRKILGAGSLSLFTGRLKKALPLLEALDRVTGA